MEFVNRGLERADVHAVFDILDASMTLFGAPVEWALLRSKVVCACGLTSKPWFHSALTPHDALCMHVFGCMT